MLIYTIRCKNNDNEIYIGSTKQTVRRREVLHKSACKSGKNTPLYNHINANGGWDDYYCELYEEFDGTLDQLKKREGELIRKFKDDINVICLNHNIAGRTPLENLNEKYKNNPDYRMKCKIQSKKQYDRLKSSLNPPSTLVDQVELLVCVIILSVIVATKC